MWTDENRVKYNRDHLRYPSGATDEVWAVIEPLLPPAKHGGRKREVDMREVFNGIMYVLSTGSSGVTFRKTCFPKAHSKPIMTRILVALFILWPAAAYALSNSPYGQFFTVTAQSIQLVQSQYIAHSSASNQQCHWSFPAIGTGDTVIGYIHSSNNMDNYMLVPGWIKDNTGTTYTMTPTAEWRPWREGITLFYLTNVRGNPISFTINFSSYPANLTVSFFSSHPI